MYSSALCLNHSLTAVACLNETSHAALRMPSRLPPHTSMPVVIPDCDGHTKDGVLAGELPVCSCRRERHLPPRVLSMLLSVVPRWGHCGRHGWEEPYVVPPEFHPAPLWKLKLAGQGTDRGSPLPPWTEWKARMKVLFAHTLAFYKTVVGCRNF